MRMGSTSTFLRFVRPVSWASSVLSSGHIGPTLRLLDTDSSSDRAAPCAKEAGSEPRAPLLASCARLRLAGMFKKVWCNGQNAREFQGAARARSVSIQVLKFRFMCCPAFKFRFETSFPEKCAQSGEAVQRYRLGAEGQSRCHVTSRTPAHPQAEPGVTKPESRHGPSPSQFLTKDKPVDRSP